MADTALITATIAAVSALLGSVIDGLLTYRGVLRTQTAQLKLEEGRQAYQAEQERRKDERALRDAKRERLRAVYMRVLHAALTTQGAAHSLRACLRIDHAAIDAVHGRLAGSGAKRRSMSWIIAREMKASLVSA